MTKTLAGIKEQNGEVKEAAFILQELQVSFLVFLICKIKWKNMDFHTGIFVQVETYGSMEKKEKVEFILEQMRLCIAVKDYIRTQIISKKINTKFFQEEGTEVRKRMQVLMKLTSL